MIKLVNNGFILKKIPWELFFSRIKLFVESVLRGDERGSNMIFRSGV
jgi:hypothetical protein